MNEWFQGLSGLEKVFTLCAVVGGVLFLIRLILQFMGVGDSDGIEDGAGEVEVSTHDSDIGFKILSFQGITAFLMMFGLAGLALVRESHVREIYSIVGAAFAGMASVWVIAQLFSMMRKLTSSGTIDLNNAVGQEGSVYLTIPSVGSGQVRIVVQNHMKIFEAVSDKKEEIKTGETIKVLRVVSGNVMIVEKV